MAHGLDAPASTRDADAPDRDSGRLRRRLIAASTRRLFPDGIRRVRFGHVGAEARATLTSAALLMCVIAALVATGWRGPLAASPNLERPYAPLVLPLTTVAAGAVSALLAGAAQRMRPPARIGVAAIAAVLALWSMDALPSLPWRLAWVLLGVAVAILGFLPIRAIARRELRTLVVLAPFAIAAVTGGSAGGIQADLATLRALQLGDVAGLVVAALGVLTLAAALEKRHSRTAHAVEGRPRPWLLAVTLAAKATLLLGLYLGLTGDWLGGEEFWRPRLESPLSWLHAFAVAGAIFAIVTRSWTQPLRASGFRRGAGILAGGAAYLYLVGAVAGLIVTLGNAISPLAYFGNVFTAANALIEASEEVQLGLAIAALLAGAYGVAVRRSWSTGWVVLLVGGIWLVPSQIGIAYDGSLPTFWAAPGQIDTALTLIAAGYAVRSAIRGSLARDARALLRVVVVPSVVLHAWHLVPGDWLGAVPAFGVLAGAAVTLLLDAPRESNDPRRNERTLSLLVAGQLALLSAFILLAPVEELRVQLESATTIAWLWLAVPVAGVLTARTRERTAGGESGGPAPGRPPEAIAS